jgi:small subunit ribosomal protein S8
MDPISDMLNRIRNAQAVSQPAVEIPFSNLKYQIAEILEKEGFCDKIEKKGRKSAKFIKINLKYVDKPSIETSAGKKIPIILGLKRISKSGQRIYTPWKKIKKIRGGYGIMIISTSKGLMTNKEARKQKIGGEVLCEIW